MQNIGSSWNDIATWMVQRNNSNSAKTMIGKLLVAAMAYYIWQERNKRFFSNKSRSVEVIADLIASSVRLKMITMLVFN